MNIATKSKTEMDKGLLAELSQFKKENDGNKLPIFTNTGLNQYITKIIQKYTKAHDAVRSSFEYQLFLSVYRGTPLHKNYVN